MYRIDENTFIDETLITCAEYQLFIDEMRNKGKYHQPDHWASYQFMAGHGRQPILGMRQADAEAFCVWLSQRENSGWRYHLPTAKEAETYQLKTYPQASLGYWLAESKRNQFFWNGPAPTNPRGLAHNLEIASELSHELGLARSRALALDMGRDIEIARSLDMDVGGSRELVRGHNKTSALDRDLNLSLGLALARDIALDRIRDRTLVRGHTRELARALALNLARSHELGLTLVLDIYLDILTLQDRIAGRSQPFEGIRIVKERIGTQKTSEKL